MGITTSPCLMVHGLSGLQSKRDDVKKSINNKKLLKFYLNLRDVGVLWNKDRRTVPLFIRVLFK